MWYVFDKFVFFIEISRHFPYFFFSYFNHSIRVFRFVFVRFMFFFFNSVTIINILLYNDMRTLLFLGLFFLLLINLLSCFLLLLTKFVISRYSFSFSHLFHPSLPHFRHSLNVSKWSDWNEWDEYVYINVVLFWYVLRYEILINL